jgi:hypothetical protein
VTGILTAAFGLALLLWVVWKLGIGIAEIAGDVRQVGWGLAVIVALGGLRFLLRAVSTHRTISGSETRSRQSSAVTLSAT